MQVMMFIMITIHLSILVFTEISSSCVPTGTSVPLYIVGCAGTLVDANCYDFKILYIVASEPIITFQLKLSTLLTLTTKRHNDFKTHV